VLAQLIRSGGLSGCVYAEPYAGGAGAALTLLFQEDVSQIVLNDADRSIYAFWRAILTRTDEFLQRLRDTPVTVREWRRQKEIYRNAPRETVLRLGFAAFYLNRTNRSGIIMNGGPIGGTSQKGSWKINARFNREGLSRRIEKIALFANRISVFNLDAMKFMKNVVNRMAVDRPLFVYLDPPYYAKGSLLYLNHYQPGDHAKLAKFLLAGTPFKWMMSYDEGAHIKKLYADLSKARIRLGYSARERRTGREFLIFSEAFNPPRDWRKSVSLLGP